MWKRIMAAFVLIAGLGINLSIAGEPEDSVPDTIYAWGKRLQFVSLERAVNSSGEIDTELLSQTAADFLRQRLDRPEGPDGCADVSVETSLDYPPEDLADLESAVENSQHVLIGRVAGLKVGFYSRLGYLVAIDTEEILAGSPRSRLYVFFPKGIFTFQGKDYCAQHDAYPNLPEPGDRMLVMHKEQLHGPLLGIAPTQLILLGENGAPEPGKNLVVYPSDQKKRKAPELRSAAEAIDRVKTLIEQKRSL